ncbi:MAG: hypothetical protein JNK37_16710 [Verrucomicrobiales bacterium]|nr:hypothetical protein [Verrucomicrobiales bacterium]
MPSLSNAADVGEAIKGLKPRWETVPGWKRKLLYAAAAVGLLGVGSDGYQTIQSNATREAASAASETRPMAAAEASRDKVGSDSTVTQAGEAVFDWGGPTGRLGLSFSLAFLAALAIRWFIKTALTIAGVAAAGAALLVHFGVIDSATIGDPSQWAKDLGPWLTDQTESLATLVKGHLPSGAASGAGLFLGLRK